MFRLVCRAPVPREVLYLTFRSIKAATEAFRMFAPQEGWNAAFAPPRVASSRLWCGNVNRQRPVLPTNRNSECETLLMQDVVAF